MLTELAFNTLLVPVDFSPNSWAALRRAVDLATGEDAAIIVLHVIDPSLPDFAESHGLGSREDVVVRMRTMGKEQLVEQVQAISAELEVDTVISEGVPFLEIIRKAEEFAVDAIVMSKVGTRGRVEKLLFGSTVEKVVRGSNKPVLVLPINE